MTPKSIYYYSAKSIIFSASPSVWIGEANISSYRIQIPIKVYTHICELYNPSGYPQKSIRPLVIQEKENSLNKVQIKNEQFIKILLITDKWSQTLGIQIVLALSQAWWRHCYSCPADVRFIWMDVFCEALGAHINASQKTSIQTSIQMFQTFRRCGCHIIIYLNCFTYTEYI